MFSADRRWWWTGEAWMPAVSPDGEYMRWSGSRWTVSHGRVGHAFAIAASLWAAEVVVAGIAFFVLILAANAEYEARGRTGYEDIGSTSISAPILIGLLLLPLIATIFVSALVRPWWLGTLVTAAIPVLIAVGSQQWTTAPLPSAVVSAAVVAAFGLGGWLAARIARQRWSLTPDARWWTDGRRNHGAVSPDGRWRWDGFAWKEAPSTEPVIARP